MTSTFAETRSRTSAAVSVAVDSDGDDWRFSYSTPASQSPPILPDHETKVGLTPMRLRLDCCKSMNFVMHCCMRGPERSTAPASRASLARPSLPLKPKRPPRPASGLTTTPIRISQPIFSSFSIIALDLIESIDRCFDVGPCNGESWSNAQSLTKLLLTRSCKKA